jgi:hypothetical protein
MFKSVIFGSFKWHVCKTNRSIPPSLTFFRNLNCYNWIIGKRSDVVILVPPQISKLLFWYEFKYCEMKNDLRGQTERLCPQIYSRVTQIINAKCLYLKYRMPYGNFVHRAMFNMLKILTEISLFWYFSFIYFHGSGIFYFKTQGREVHSFTVNMFLHNVTFIYKLQVAAEIVSCINRAL